MNTGCVTFVMYTMGYPCCCSEANDPGFGNKPEGDSLKGSHKGWVFLGVIPFLIPCLLTSKLFVPLAPCLSQDDLRHLAELKTAGALSDGEFQAAKRKLLS